MVYLVEYEIRTTHVAGLIQTLQGQP